MNKRIKSCICLIICFLMVLVPLGIVYADEENQEAAQNEQVSQEGAETPAEEVIPAEEATQEGEAAEEETPAIEETQVTEEAPNVEETPAEEVIPAEEATQEGEVVEEETPAIEEAPVTEEPPQLSEQILEMIDEDNIEPIEEESYIVDMRVPTNLMFIIDPFNMLGNGTVSSTLIPIENKSEFPVVFSIDTVNVLFNHGKIELSPGPVDQDPSITEKIIEIKMVWVDEEGNEEERVVSGAPEQSAYSRVLEPGEKIHFYITGSLTSNSKKEWRNDDIELSFNISMDKAPEPEIIEEEITPAAIDAPVNVENTTSEPIEAPKDTAKTTPAIVVLPEPITEPEPDETIYSIQNDA